MSGQLRNAPGQEVVIFSPTLLTHAAPGFVYDLRQPNCVMRWANVEPGSSEAVDVVVHFHGYKQHNAMRIQDKANASGVDLAAAGVGRPTLGLVPHGRAFVSSIANTDGFDFPAIDSGAELLRFIDGCLSELGTRIQGSPQRGRVLLTAHSGGGQALNRLLQSLGQSPEVHGCHYFDATYGDARPFTDAGGWLAASLARDAHALEQLSSEEDRAGYMRESGAGLRIVFLDNTGTEPAARLASSFIASHVAGLSGDANVKQLLQRYYRVQRVPSPPQIAHAAVPRMFGPRLLANPGDDLGEDVRDP